MEYLRTKIRGLLRFPSVAADLPQKEISVSDAYLIYIFRIIFWENIKYTLKVFLGINYVFWCIMIFHMRFYGSLALIVLVSFITDFCYRNVILADCQNEYSETVNNAKYLTIKAFDILRNLRNQSKFVFTSSMVMTFLALRIVASSIPGFALVYLIFLLIFFLPLIYKLLPVRYSKQVQEYFKTLNTSELVAEDELIPFIAEKDIAKLDNLFIDKSTEVTTQSLIKDVTSMPSYLEVAEIPECIKEEDLLPHRTTPVTPSEMSSDSDSDHREMSINSSHFNSSSSEDDVYIKNMSVPREIKDYQETSSETLKTMFNSVMAAVGSNVLKNVFQPAEMMQTSRPKKKSDSDSDFEIIDNDDVS